MRRLFFFMSGALAAVPLVGYTLWRRTSAEVGRSVLGGAVDAGSVSWAAQLSEVPEPVARFFRRTLPDGQRHIRTVRLRQEGEFFMNGRWRPLRAEQVFSTTPPAFMWDARISMAPLMPVYVRDSYAGGRASMRASVLAVYPVVNQAGDAGLNAGALMRYLGEAAWFPTRLLPGNGLTWEAVDANTARATLVDGATTVSLRFTFDETGDLVEVYSPDRFREVDGTYVPTPWRVRALGHEVHNGLRLMSPAVAEWLLPEGPLPCWRGRISFYEFTI